MVEDSSTGQVFEQAIQVNHNQHSYQWRRVVVRLNQPTRSGDPEVAVLTNLPSEQANAATVADLYLNRWTVEGLFQVLTDCFACEISTLGYPQAALFAYGMALVAYNLLAVIRAALGCVHGHGKIEAGISNYYLVEEIQGTYRGMMIALPPEQWQVFAGLSAQQLSQCLQQWAAQVNLKRFSSSPRGPKKPPPHRPREPHRPHVSTARLLASLS